MDINKKNEIIEKINNIFVDDFNIIKKSQESINEYLKIFNITQIYNYNSFCVDFLNKSENILDNLNDMSYDNITVQLFIADILSEMIKSKIVDSNELNEQDKAFALMKLELDKYLSKNLEKK